jgi:hypothetical protein
LLDNREVARINRIFEEKEINQNEKIILDEEKKIIEEISALQLSLAKVTYLKRSILEEKQTKLENYEKGDTQFDKELLKNQDEILSLEAKRTKLMNENLNECQTLREMAWEIQEHQKKSIFLETSNSELERAKKTQTKIRELIQKMQHQNEEP